MRLLEFATYGQYVRSQQRTSRRKSRVFEKVCFTEVEIDNIVDWIDRRVPRSEMASCLCHGVRTGAEVIEFRKRLPNASVIGTDLVPLVDDPSLVRKMDFSDPVPEWTGKFDMVYSNALDHARDPLAALRTWIGQLNERGRLFVQWTTWHMPDKVRGGDCFGAHLDEYMGLVRTAGRLEDLIYTLTRRQRGNWLRWKAMESVVVVGRPKGGST